MSDLTTVFHPAVGMFNFFIHLYIVTHSSVVLQEQRMGPATSRCHCSYQQGRRGVLGITARLHQVFLWLYGVQYDPWLWQRWLLRSTKYVQ